MTDADTKTRILDAAERLFADKGFATTSLRDITSEAKVNLAGINYHFKSKDNLIYAVFARCIIPINQERLRLLGEIETKAGEKILPLENVIRALVAPIFMITKTPQWQSGVLLRLFARLHTESGEKMWSMFKELFGEVMKRFIGAFKRALPELEPVEFFWRIHFTIGVMVHSVDTSKIQMISGGACNPADVKGIIERMVNFTMAGLKAPVAQKKAGGKQ